MSVLRDADEPRWAALLRRAARGAVRAHGHAEPNPLVGAALLDARGELVAIDHHRRHGGPHAEAIVLRRAGERARGSTLLVTLEPCAHHGKTPPCTDAILAAGVARVVYARPDESDAARGGAALLRAGGVETVHLPVPEAVRLAEPWAHRARTGLPFLTLKWAQTLDGRIAARTGDSRWISGDASRRMVHRERGRTDFVLTGIGTVEADDPRLTARGGRVRRVARRVLLDRALRLGEDAALLEALPHAPLTIFASPEACGRHDAKVARLAARGAEVVPLALDANGDLPLERLLRHLVERHDATHGLVEAGPGLASRLLAQGLVRRLWVFTAPIVLGDDAALPPLRGFARAAIAEADRFALLDLRRRGSDAVALLGPDGTA